MVQSAPRTLQLLKILVMHDEVDLIRQFLVELSDHRLDGFDNVRTNKRRLFKRLRG